MRKIPNRFKYQAAESSDNWGKKQKQNKKQPTKSVKLLYTQVFFRKELQIFLVSLGKVFQIF